jgi:hypothetical protein
MKTKPPGGTYNPWVARGINRAIHASAVATAGKYVIGLYPF